MKQQRILSSSSQAPQMEVSTKRHSIHQEKEAAKKSKLETTKAAENEVDEKQQVETTKAENEVDEKQNAESTEDGKAIAAEMHEVDSADDDAYEDLLRSIEGPDWEDKFYTLSSTDAEDGDVLSFPSISVEDSEEDDASSEEVSSKEVSSEALDLHEKEKLEADIDRAVATDKRRRKKNEGREKEKEQQLLM